MLNGLCPEDFMAELIRVTVQFAPASNKCVLNRAGLYPGIWRIEAMIEVTRLNKKSFVLNCDWIETVEATPDTVITLTNGKKYVVSEKVDEIIEKVVEYKQKVFTRAIL